MTSMQEVGVGAQEGLERGVHLVSDGGVLCQKQLVPEDFIPHAQRAEVEIG